MSTRFVYDFNSPYAYLSAVRIGDVLPGAVRWEPIAFGALLRQIGKVPWSLSDPATVEAGRRECDRRAAARGLPPLRWSPEWPAGDYSLLVLRAALVAERAGRLVAFSLAAYRRRWADGRDLRDLDVVLDAAGEAGVDPADVRAGVADRAVKDELRARTEAVAAEGITGIPTIVLADGRRFWGDDRLEDAAAAVA